MQVLIDRKEACSIHGDPRLSNIYVKQRALDGAEATDADFMFVGFHSARRDGSAACPATEVTAATAANTADPAQLTAQERDREMLLASLRGAAAAAAAGEPA